MTEFIKNHVEEISFMAMGFIYGLWLAWELIVAPDEDDLWPNKNQGHSKN